MKALVYTQPGVLEIQDWPVPEPSEGQALVKVEGVGICGSDMAGFEGRSSRRVPPLILGHEVVGTVAVADGGSPLRPGERVVVNPLQSCGSCPACAAGNDNLCENWRLLGMDRVQGGFAEYVTVSSSNLHPLAPNVTIERAVMVEPLANSVHVMRLAGAGQLQTIVIVGGGTQGILALMLARHLGHRRVAVIETSAARRDLAASRGASLVIDPHQTDPAAAVREWAPGGTDIAIEAVGLESTRQTAIACARKGGTVIMLGLHDQTSGLDFATLVRSEIKVLGSFAYTARDFSRSLQLLTDGDLDPSPWVRIRPLADGRRAFEDMLRRPDATLKTVLVP